MNVQELIKKAYEAREYSYSPYSNFMVGAALLCKNGEVYTGCNIESVSYSPTNCAERTAFFKAVSQGEKEFSAIIIIGGKKQSDVFDFCSPCGVCRQVMMEFCDPKKFEIILAKNQDEYVTYKLEQLMPMGFAPSKLL